MDKSQNDAEIELYKDIDNIEQGYLAGKTIKKENSMIWQKQTYYVPILKCPHCKEVNPFTLTQRPCIHKHILLVQMHCVKCGGFIGENVLDMKVYDLQPSLSSQLDELAQSLDNFLKDIKT